MLDLVAAQELFLAIGLECGVRWVWGTWVGVTGERAGGVREHDGRSCGQTWHQLWVGRGGYSPFLPQQAGGMRTAGGVWEG